MMAFPCSGDASVIVCHGTIYSEAQCSLAVVTEFTVAAARTRWRLQLASCDPDGPIRGSIEQDGLDPYAQAGFDVEYASQTQKLDGGWLLLCGPGRCLAHVRIGRRWW